MGKSKYGDIEKEKLESSIKSNIGENKAEVIENGDTLLVKIIESNRYYEVDSNGDIAEPKTIIVDKYAGDISKGGMLDGSGEKPFVISCIEDLVTFSIMSNGGDENLDISATTFSNQYIVLTRTLDFKSIFSYNDYTTTKYGDLNKDGKVEDIKTELTKTDDNCIGFTPIASTEGSSFKGNFDGKENQICNLYQNRIDKKAGLFGYMYAASIQNLGVVNSILKSDSDIGGIVIVAQNSVIKKCYSIMDISLTGGKRTVGGIVCTGWGNKIEECYHIGNIVSPESSVSGILGSGGGSGNAIKNCYHIGNITSNIAGGIAGGTADCCNCYSVGKITKTYMGGVINGMNYGGHIVHCFGLRGDYGTLPEGELEESKIISYLSQYNNKNYGHLANTVVGYECNILTEEEMKSENFVNELNILIEAGVSGDNEGVITTKSQEVWKKDENNINDGYPIFNWQE